MLTRNTLATILPALLLLLAACGADEPAPVPPDTAGDEMAAVPEPPEPVPEPEPDPEPEGDLLRVRLNAGDSYKFRETMEIDTEGTMQGMDIGSQIEIHSDYAYDVVSVDDAGVADVTVTYGRVRGKLVSAMMGEIEFDSASEEEPDPMSAMVSGQFLARAGTSFQVRIDPLGVMSDFRGLDAIVAKMAAANPMAAQMQGGEEGIAREFERQTANQLFRYPEERLVDDKSWTLNSEMAMGPLALEITHEMTLEGEVDDGLSISRVTELGAPDAEGEDPATAQLGLQDFEQKAVAVVGKDDGLPLRVDASLKMLLNPGGQGEMKQAFAQKIERVTE